MGPFGLKAGSTHAPRWGNPTTSTPFLTNSLIRRTSSAPLLPLDAPEGSKPAVPLGLVSSFDTPMSNSSTSREGPAQLSPTNNRWVGNPVRTSSAARKGKAKMEDQDGPHTHPPPFTGRPLPAPLLATLISESAPLEHEMRSEARLRSLLSSHPSALPLAPRAPRSVRGRFPETAGDDDDDDDSFSRSWNQRNWMGRGNRLPSSDSDSDDDIIEEVAEPHETVNSAFAAGMDMDRPECQPSGPMGAGNGSPAINTSGGVTGTATWGVGSGGLIRSNAPRMSFGTAGQAATALGMVPSPGTGLGLPTAFGGLGMGGNGGTPLGSPTTERLEVGYLPRNGANDSLLLRQGPCR